MVTISPTKYFLGLLIHKNNHHDQKFVIIFEKYCVTSEFELFSEMEKGDVCLFCSEEADKGREPEGTEKKKLHDRDTEKGKKRQVVKLGQLTQMNQQNQGYIISMPYCVLNKQY